MTKPIHIRDAAAPVIVKLALAEIDTAVDRLRMARNLLAQQFASPERDIPTAQEQETEQ
jgi:hypothetical protein